MTNAGQPTTADLSASELVVLWDTMCDASNDARAACVWLARHAATAEESERWWAESRAILEDRRCVDLDGGPIDLERSHVSLPVEFG